MANPASTWAGIPWRASGAATDRLGVIRHRIDVHLGVEIIPAGTELAPGRGNRQLGVDSARQLHGKYTVPSSSGDLVRMRSVKSENRRSLDPNVVSVAIGCAAFVAVWNVLLVHRPADLRSSGVAAWWTVLCAVAVFNACGWHRTAQRVALRSATVEADGPDGRFQRAQLWLSAVFVLGCGFRSLIPRADVQRFGLVDSWLSSVVIGRSVATAAELCFVAQWALLLHAAARGVGSRFGVAVAWLLVPLIAVAEGFSWSGVLTTCYLFNAAEESLWALAAALLVAGGLIVWARRPAARGPFLVAALMLGGLYIAYMVACDIPMYVSRWQADEASGRTYLTLGEGLRDAWSRRVVTFAWEQWRAEMPWMTLYFSVCVWWSLALVHAPRPVPDRPVPGRSRLV
jgi:hypothetical protein